MDLSLRNFLGRGGTSLIGVEVTGASPRGCWSAAGREVTDRGEDIYLWLSGVLDCSCSSSSSNSFLSNVLVQTSHDDAKERVVTDGEAVICLPRQEDESSLAPCCQEETDTRIMLHVAHAAAHDHRQIQV
ncbi:hypothetical protein Pcinc_010792 [Petrolisthes cinctipes]|uniref:Uncharacterized protein n=1 Tax=Petrolisthes cinctipes TaxID=88211 RepID=A0AAE1KU51_PETCI|nr:hypothetical protein Pcinc_010792 [Petrolisthes cinctipes]